MPSVTLPSEIEIAYDTFGDEKGEPLLLIMGLGAQMIAWRDAFCEHLADQGFYVVRFDNRDIGLSSILDHLPTPNMLTLFRVSVLKQFQLAPYYLKEMAEDVVALMDALGIPQAHVCGASMGGMIAQEMAINFPDRLKSMTLIMTTPGDRRLPGMTLKVYLSTLRQIASLKGDQFTRQRARHLKVIGSVAELEPKFEDLLAHSRRLEKRAPQQPGSVRQVLAVLASPDRSEALKQVRHPTLIIHGEVDPLVPLAHGKALKKLLPHARFELINNMGHDIPALKYETFAQMIGEVAEL